MNSHIVRWKIRITGTVQGIGFRPFVWRLANELCLRGRVENGVRGVVIEAEGELSALENFIARIHSEKPPISHIEKIDREVLPLAHYEKFEITESDGCGEKTALVLPDIAICPDCLREIFDPKDRRWRYPFTNCTNCGPRFTIIEKIPYDRANTSMKHFPMCPLCEAEYKNPADRRFHAEPTACPDCGPRIELWEQDGTIIADCGEALFIAETILWNNGIIALKGLGGFQLLANARNEDCVRRLRKAKGRSEEKPFALMYPNMAMVKKHCEVSPEEEKLLLSPKAPIVLLERRKNSDRDCPCGEVARGSTTLGIMLPYTPLHHLLLEDLRFPLVATSGNISDEPIETDENEAVKLLGKLCDALLVHNRNIVRHADDSIVRVIEKTPVVLRRARGYAPLPVKIHHEEKNVPCVAAFGPHLKNTGAVLIGDKVFLTQHIGDMETMKSSLALQKALRDTLAFREKIPEIVVCDAHPDYVSTRMAERFASEYSAPLLRVPHHEAHVLSCMAENNILEEECLGIAWDGTGYGEDGLSWGGEFFQVGPERISRIGHLDSFPLIGGDRAAREPKRVASAMLAKVFGEKVFEDEIFAPIRNLTKTERKIFREIIEKDDAVKSTSVGRLFDAVASLLDICHVSSYEGHAAMLLEQAINGCETNRLYRIPLRNKGVSWSFSWWKIIFLIVKDLKRGVPKEIISATFHNTLAAIIASLAEKEKAERVALSGGCFQNKYLLEKTISLLKERGIVPFFHKNIPANDGGIAMGQIAAAVRFLKQNVKE